MLFAPPLAGGSRWVSLPRKVIFPPFEIQAGFHPCVVNKVYLDGLQVVKGQGIEIIDFPITFVAHLADVGPGQSIAYIEPIVNHPAVGGLNLRTRIQDDGS